MPSKTTPSRSLERVVRPLAWCGMCGGRGINSNGADCEHCDCGKGEVPFDFIARNEIGYDPHSAARNPHWKGGFESA